MDTTELSGEVTAVLSVGLGDPALSPGEAGSPARTRPGGEMVLAELAKRGGRVFHATDESVLAAFRAVADAVECGTRIQSRLAHSGLPLSRLGLACEVVSGGAGAVPREGMAAAERLRRQASPGEMRVSPTLAGGITFRIGHGQAPAGARSRRFLAAAACLQLAILLIYFLSWYGLISWKAVNLARYGSFCWPAWLCDGGTPRMQPRVRPGEVFVPKPPVAK